MLNNDSHLSDQELLLLADGEFSVRRAVRIRAHLAACWACRARMGKIEDAIADFVGLYHSETAPQMKLESGPRALLKSRLAELDALAPAKRASSFLQSALIGPIAASILAALLLSGMAIWKIHRQRSTPEFKQLFATPEFPLLPNGALTPGATRPVTTSEVCRERPDGAVLEVPISLQRQLLQEYGITNAQPKDYEFDYLITPELGGSKDIRNLWPEPHSGLVWNSYVKDDLENRLHRMVCDGTLDLATAQRDIATDWIGAYKKYFHTEIPLSNPSFAASDPRHG